MPEASLPPSPSRGDQLKAVIAANISDLRREHHMTQLELAERLNYTDKAISKWERGESIPDILILKSIADLFGVTVDYLLEETHPEPPAPEPEPEEPAVNRMEAERSIRARGFVTGMSILLVWLAATVLFIVFDMIPGRETYTHGIVFAYAIPASLVLWLVMNSIWFNRRRNYLIISLLMWSVLLLVHLSVWIFAGQQIWLIFLLGIPGQAIILMWASLKHGSPFKPRNRK